MVASPLAATVVTEILRCDFCAAKIFPHWQCFAVIWSPSAAHPFSKQLGSPPSLGLFHDTVRTAKITDRTWIISAIRNLEKGAVEKGICIKLSEIDLQICDNLRTLPLMHETNTGNFGQLWRSICDKFAQRPPRERPLLGISEATNQVKNYRL